MKLILLGTGGFIPAEKAQTACFMLPEVGVLLDAGSGLYRMNRYLQTDELDIYLSHAHGDHTSGLIYLFASFLVHSINHSGEAVNETTIQTLAASSNRRSQVVRVHGGKATVDFLAKEYEAYRLNLQIIQERETLPQGGLLTAFPLAENAEFGFRLDWHGHSLAYVTDTTARPDAPYIEHIREVDLLLHECNGPDSLAAMNVLIHHSTTSAVARLAAQAQVGRLVLVHKNPIEHWSIEGDLEAARGIFPSTIIGEDGMELDF